METVHTTRNTLVVDELLSLPKNAEIAPTYSKASDPSTLAAVTAQCLQERGPVIVMHARPDWVWTLAERLKIESNRNVPTQRIELVQDFLRMEFGSSFPLIDLMSFGIGVHHAGLSDDVRVLMEWLLEANDLKFLVATTTIAQGVNFPISGVVMASHQYPLSSSPFWVDIPPDDFWNIAGRAGRISQGSLGVVALVANDPSRTALLRTFINNQAGELNSALLALAREAGELLSDLGQIVYSHPEWSTFVQYLTHTYRQMGQPEGFADEIEQVLRGTFGFEKLRRQDSILANRLLDGIHSYAQYLQKPKQPLKLVDSTGFSLQSINTVLQNKGNIDGSSWDSASLFTNRSNTLRDMMGVLLKVPELRENLKAVTGGRIPDGDKLALIVKDWVNGVSVPDIASRYFMDESGDVTKAMTKCGQNLFGKLTQTAAWGLGALLSITGNALPEEQLRSLSNLPSRVYYGVNDDAAIALRLLGVPRAAATKLAQTMSNVLDEPLTTVRGRLRGMDEANWRQALGESEGTVYQKVWRVLEGLE